MVIPKLPPDANDYILNITINKKVRPYLTYWYQNKKLQGETPETFLIRIMKEQALDAYVNGEYEAFNNNGRIQAIQDITDIQQDVG